jgi:hypothetical protein
MEDVFKCPICFEGNMDENGQIIQKFTLQCNHEFHTKCICESLRYDCRCPVCRDPGLSVEDQKYQSEMDAERDFVLSISRKQRRAFRQRFINASIRYCRKQLKYPKNEEYKYIKTFMRKYDNAKKRLGNIKKERKSIYTKYREISKKYTNNPIVKKYNQLNPWKVKGLIQDREYDIYRMFSLGISYQELYNANKKKVK